MAKNISDTRDDIIIRVLLSRLAYLESLGLDNGYNKMYYREIKKEIKDLGIDLNSIKSGIKVREDEELY